MNATNTQEKGEQEMTDRAVAYLRQRAESYASDAVKMRRSPDLVKHAPTYETIARELRSAAREVEGLRRDG